MMWDYEKSNHWRTTERIAGGWCIRLRSLDLRRIAAAQYRRRRWVRLWERFKFAIWLRWRKYVG